MSLSALVMLLTQSADAAMHWVASELDALGVDHFVYDLSAFPLESKIDCHITSSRTWSVLLTYAGRQIDLGTVTGIWNGHVSDFNFGDKLHKDVIRYAKAECAECVGGILRSIEPIVWMNHPDAGLRASYKPYQLHIASSVGLTIPATIISNNPYELKEFYRHFGGQVVCKSFHIDSNPRPGVMLRAPYTTLVSKEDLQNLDSCVPCSTMFQEYVPQLYADLWNRDTLSWG
ncbi:MvdC/MvdD family ATP grasp protein [Thermobaculum terrenum]|uniref:MvdC/MvdD family ATP grasp protein n=1 Tax=Thermobaculum terrenum TaxID=166501 RepID=UPI00059E16BC